jgi:outer membrane protein assembly factor BamB
VVPSADTLNRLQLKLGWRAYLPLDGTRDGILSAQVIGREMLVQLRSGAVLALNADTGTNLWQSRPGAPYKATYPLGYNYNTVFGLNGTKLYALDRGSGVLQWIYDLPGAPTAAPVADAERVYVCVSGGRFLVYDLTRLGPRGEGGPAPGTSAYRMKGKDEEAEKEKPSEGTPMGRKGYATTSKSFERGSVPVPVGPYANLTTDRTASANDWTLPLQYNYVADSRLDQAPLLTPRRSIKDAGFLLISGTDGASLTLPKEEKAIHRRLQTDSRISAPMGHYTEIAYVPLQNGELLALGIESGLVVWHTGVGGAITRQPAVTDEDVYIVSTRDGLVRMARDTGRVVWRFPGVDSFLTAGKRFVYGVDRVGQLVIIDKARGTRVAVQDMRDFRMPVLNELTDRVYLASSDGLLICLHDRDSTRPIWNKKVEEDRPIAKKRPEERVREKEEGDEKPKKEMEKKEMEKKEEEKKAKKDD